MDKILLIISREYLSRVRKRSFVIMTLLGPLLMAGFVFFTHWSAQKAIDTKYIQVIDVDNRFADAFEDSDETVYTFETDFAMCKKKVIDGISDGLLVIPELDFAKPKGIVFYSINNPSLNVINTLQKRIKSEIESEKLLQSGLDQVIINNLKSNVKISTINWAKGADGESSSATASMAIGYIASFTIYMFIFIYGSMCMKGVLEEKTSRVIEILITTVKPFHVMIGKVIGIAGVGLTQFLLWIILTGAIVTAGASYLSANNNRQEAVTEIRSGNPMIKQSPSVSNDEFGEIKSALKSINIGAVVGAFLFFFFSGYLLYGALFAAIGAAVDSDTEIQQFMFPITIPLLISVVTLSAVIQDPHGSFAFWMSIIPFTAPVVMMMRVPFGVQPWELILSMSLMIIGFIFTQWIGSRIYRVGILMHGTIVNYKVLAKWFFMKN
jgi:ABC-2 type transport system permease protein